MQNETLRQELSRLTDAHSALDREFRESARDEAALKRGSRLGTEKNAR
jgi:hypothetical protein